MKNIKQIHQYIKDSENDLACLKIQAEQKALEIQALKTHLQLEIAKNYPLKSLIGHQMIYHISEWGFEKIQEGHQIFSQDFFEHMTNEKNIIKPSRLVDGETLNKEFDTQHFSESHDYVIYDSYNTKSLDVRVEYAMIAL